MTTVELLVNMHCEACAQQLRRKILKMRGMYLRFFLLSLCWFGSAIDMFLMATSPSASMEINTI